MTAQPMAFTLAKGDEGSPLLAHIDFKAATRSHQEVGRSADNPKLQQKIARLLRQGNKLSSNGQYHEALKLHFAAWQLDYENLDSIKCLAHSLGQTGARGKALELFEIVLQRRPDDPDLTGLLGQIAIDLEMWEEALKLNRIYIAARPDNELGYNNLATALRHLERLDETVAFLKDVIPMFPESAPLWNVLATAVTFRDGFETALPFYEEALRLDPRLWQTLNNLGRAYNDRGEFEKVVEYCSRANAVRGDQPQSHIGLAFGLLGLGELEKGWREYEWRQHPLRNTALRWLHGLPRWDGQPLAGKSILVSSEQGIGDEILFGHMLPDVFRACDEVYISCEKRLVPLFQRSFPKALAIGSFDDKTHNGFRYRLLPFVDDLPRKPDYFIEMGSLGKFYRNSIADFPAPGGGFLVPDAGRLAHWRARLAGLGDGLKVGVCWRSGLRNIERNIWYADLAAWAPIFAQQGCHFINLQYGDCEEELGFIRERFGVTVHDWDDIDLKKDQDDCAALTKACDLVISIGAAPGMMAYGVGTPVLWMFPFPPWWCFGQSPKTPLFAHARVISPATPGDWPAVAEETAHWLACAIKEPEKIARLLQG
ncbi:MAG: tetratricopeptide repeat protein [Pseudomonadota bacterium]